MLQGPPERPDDTGNPVRLIISAGVVTDDRQPRFLSTSTTASPARHFGDIVDFKAELSDVKSGLSVIIEADLKSRFRFFHRLVADFRSAILLH